MAGVRFTRRIRGLDRADPRPTAGPLRILAAVAAPERTKNAPLDIEAEMQAIVDVVGGLGGGAAEGAGEAVGRGKAQVTILEVAGPAQIAEALRRDTYHVLHLSAHGWPTGVELENEDGDAVGVDAEALAQVLRHGDKPLPLLVLSSCAGAAGGGTGLAATLVRHGADRVIAMQASVSDSYATRLLGLVYAEIAGRNPPVAAALAYARSVLHREAVMTTSSAHQPRPEYAVATLLAAAGDPPLCDPAAAPVDLRRRDLSISYERLADLANAAGEMVEARQRYEQALAIVEQLAKADPITVQYRDDARYYRARLVEPPTVEGRRTWRQRLSRWMRRWTRR